jgi:hypothetical protein
VQIELVGSIGCELERDRRGLRLRILLLWVGRLPGLNHFHLLISPIYCGSGDRMLRMYLQEGQCGGGMIMM